MASDLDAPLGRRRAKPPARPRRHLPIARLAAGAVVALLLAVALRVLLVEDPNGGRPFAEVAVNTTRDANPVAGETVLQQPGGPITVGPEIPASELGSVPGEESTPGAAPDALVGVDEPDAQGLFPDLMEQTEFGPIPRIGPGGQTPFDAYRRPALAPETAGGRPLIAIVVSGLGLNLSGSMEAIEALPENVSLAFAPYGRELEQTSGSARADGHEVFLEVPLEPFDYPENDPGPDTLLTGQPPRDNMAKLFRVLAKLTGYAGVINNMGARFSASGADFGPVMEELGARGLGYLDDGSSNRSLSPQLAQANRVPFGRVDMMLDGNPARAAILENLSLLETKAREQGTAMGIVTALPVSVQTIAEWARGLEDKGIVLVPASALMKG